MTRARKSQDEGMRTRAARLRLDEAGRPASLDEAARSVEIVAASEAPVMVWDWELGRVPEILLMSGLREVEQVPLLDTHNAWETNSVFGSVRGLRVAGDRLLGRAFYSSVEEADKAFTKTREGHLTDYSIGYRVRTYLKAREGENVVHEGRSFTGPCIVGVEWELHEVSACAVGADASAKARAGTDRSATKEDGMETWMRRMREKLGLPENADADAVRAELERRAGAGPDSGNIEDQGGASETDLETDGVADRSLPQSGSALHLDSASGFAPRVQTSAAGGDAAVLAAREAVAEERARVAEIQALCARHGCEDWVPGLVADGTGVDQAQRRVLERLAACSGDGTRNVPGFRVEMGAAEADKFRAAAKDALRLRGGGSFASDGAPAEGAREMMSLSLRELARECLVRSGQRAPGNVLELVGRALTSSDLPNILADVANKSLLEGFELAGETWGEWCADGSLGDFKPATLARAGEFDDLEEVPEGGEYSYGSLEDVKETVKLATYGKLFVITRQAIINDDLGLITETPRKMGEAAARKVGDLPYAVLAANAAMGDGKPLFHAGHANLAPAGTALDVEPLDAGFLAMSSQKDLSGKARLNIRPTFLLAPVSLMGTGEQFFKTERIGGQENKPNLANIYAGDVLRRIYEARLNDASTKAWYLAGPKGKTVKVFFLNGQKSPYLESRQGWSVDGTEYKVRIDAAAKAVDYRALYKNPGA